MHVHVTISFVMFNAFKLMFIFLANTSKLRNHTLDFWMGQLNIYMYTGPLERLLFSMVGRACKSGSLQQGKTGLVPTWPNRLPTQYPTHPCHWASKFVYIQNIHEYPWISTMISSAYKSYEPRSDAISIIQISGPLTAAIQRNGWIWVNPHWLSHHFFVMASRQP